MQMVSELQLNLNYKFSKISELSVTSCKWTMKWILFLITFKWFFSNYWTYLNFKKFPLFNFNLIFRRKDSFYDAQTSFLMKRGRCRLLHPSVKSTFCNGICFSLSVTSDLERTLTSTWKMELATQMAITAITREIAVMGKSSTVRNYTCVINF